MLRYISFGNKKFKVLILLFFIVSLGLSTYIHIPYPPNRQPPLNNFGLLYSDIIHGVFVPRFLDVVSSYGFLDSNKVSEYWYNAQVVEELVYGRSANYLQCPVPYRDYKFEYPPLVAAAWYMSTCVAYLYTYRFIKTPSNPLEYRSIVENYVIPIHFSIQVGMLLIFCILTLIYLYKLLKQENDASRLLLFLILPSTVIYITYNWDIIAAAFTLMSLHSLTKNRYASAGVFLGLATATKVLPIFIAIPLLYEFIQRMYKTLEFRESAKRYGIGLLTSIAIPYTIPAILYQKGFSNFLNHHLTWYCENCLYLPFIQDIWSPIHRILFFSIATIMMLTILAVEVNDNRRLYEVSFLALSTSMLFNYVFSPQMMVMLSPLALLALSQNLLKYYVVADAANALIISIFFKDAEIRSYIARYINLHVEFSPWSIESPVQWAAFTRNMILLIIFLSLLSRELKNVCRR
uniref:DUF2029 domain-containing protein n=1 Tax=Ignisphaera aggregans TaxID=334771 RepID=A0A7J2U734_9CREN